MIEPEMHTRDRDVAKRFQVSFESGNEIAKALERDRENVGIGPNDLVPDRNTADPAVLYRHLLCSQTVVDGYLRVLRPRLLGVQVSQWHVRNAHFVRSCVC